MDRRIDEFDKIYIRDLPLRCVVGINPDERKKTQDVLINVTIYADLSKPCESDDIDDTVNYERVMNDIVSLVETSSYFLVEKMAETIAHACLAYEGVESVAVSVEKPDALPPARSVGVEVFRTNLRSR